ncbi:MAG: sigma 54-interacting transcriptional regulator [Myxococcales bacterium]
MTSTDRPEDAWGEGQGGPAPDALAAELTAARAAGSPLGPSRAMARVRDLIERYAGADATVLIRGETGTGKGLVASLLHQRSGRRDGPFIAFNAAAIPSRLLESELFGHEKGAFTGAHHTHRGLVAAAHGGTLFLDEVDSLEPRSQAKLLRVLDQRRVRRVGGSHEEPVDIRVIAATNADLEGAVQERTFLPDLYYRLNVLPIALPPLRERGRDVLLIAQALIERAAREHGKRVVGMAPGAAEALLAHDWPGNVRELENVVARAVLCAGGSRITAAELGPLRSTATGGGPQPDDIEPLAHVERVHVHRVTEAFRGNLSAAARALQIDRGTLQRKLRGGPPATLRTGSSPPQPLRPGGSRTHDTNAAREPDDVDAAHELAGSAPAMVALRRELRRIADSPLPVALVGETGTGKEVVARALHALGPHRGGPFIAINCAAIPEDLLESELFGHERGAFTGADAARTGLLARADGGTVMLDEIHTLALSMQAKLLRAIEARAVRPVGSAREQVFDARIVCASNQSLHLACERGLFRVDLLYRLDVLHLEVPPLRERGRDVIELAQRFLQRAASRRGKTIRGLSPSTEKLLLDHPWPGNVRELSNVMEAAVALCDGERLEPEHLPLQLRAEGSGVRVRPTWALEEVRRAHVRRALAATGGNVAAAARLLRVPRQRVYRELRRAGPGLEKAGLSRGWSDGDARRSGT